MVTPFQGHGVVRSSLPGQKLLVSFVAGRLACSAFSEGEELESVQPDLGGTGDDGD
jgi:hypothetical protein